MNASPSPSANSFRQALHSRICEFDGLSQALTGWGEAQGIAPRTLHSVILILDELFANVVMHGYCNDPAGEVEVEARLEQDRVEVTLTDHASPFNPLEVPEPDTSLSIEEREIGGLGLLFVRRTADTLDYQLRQERGQQPSNVLHFSKRLT